MSEYNEEMRACVERGMALLDEKCPGWQRWIDLESLDLSNGYFCILGQVFGSYQDGLSDVFGITPDLEIPNVVTDAEYRIIVNHGFVTSIDYVELEDIWKELLAQREEGRLPGEVQR